MTGAQARELIESSGITREVIAAHLGITSRTLRNWQGADHLIRRDQYALERAIKVLKRRAKK